MILRMIKYSTTYKSNEASNIKMYLWISLHTMSYNSKMTYKQKGYDLYQYFYLIKYILKQKT